MVNKQATGALSPRSMNLRARFKSAIFVIPLVSVLLYHPFSRIILHSCIAILSLYEANNVFQLSKLLAPHIFLTFTIFLYTSTLTLTFLSHVNIYLYTLAWLLTLGVIIIHILHSSTTSLLDTCMSVFSVSEQFHANPFSSVIFIQLWLVTPLSCLGYIHSQVSSGFHVLLCIVFATVAGENGGLFGGYTLGTRKPFPSVSPNKTLEGFIFQILSSMLACVLMYMYTSFTPYWFSSTTALTYGFMYGVGAIAGDLLESYVKRQYDVKDTNTIFPGWGGI